MKKSNINKEQRTIISNAISNVIYNLKKYDNVECVLMNYYKKMDKLYITNKDMLRLDVVVDKYDENLFDVIDEINNSFSTKNNIRMFGLRLNLTINFDTLDDDMSLKSIKDLYNAIILYDKTGKYFNKQDELKANREYYYEYNNRIKNDLVLKNIRKNKN